MPTTFHKMEKDEINALPIWAYSGKTIVLSTPHDAKTAATQLLEQHILGFDTETRPSFRKGQKYSPALLQLATDTTVYLFQLKKTGLPEALLAVLENEQIHKAGVAISYDIQELQNITPFTANGFVDLGKISHKLHLKNHGLRTLAAALLGIRISKNARQSNWENDTLTAKQIAYAATDAWLSRELYLKMSRLDIQNSESFLQ